MSVFQQWSKAMTANGKFKCSTLRGVSAPLLY